MRGAIAAALCLTAWPLSAAEPARDDVADAEWMPVLEPGVRTPEGDGYVPVRAPEAMAGRMLRELDLVLEVSGEPLRTFTLASTGPAPGGVPLELVVIVEPRALGATPSDAWIDALARVLGDAPDGERRQLVVVGGDRLDAGAGGSEGTARVRRAIGDASPAPLWDTVLAELDRLSTGEGAPRRVVLLVSAGRESKASRHPAVTCVDAALRARVAIYALATGASRDARARLAEIARESGGALRDAAGPGTCLDLVRTIESVRTVRIPSLDRVPPVAVRVGMGAGTPVYAAGEIRVRTAVGVERPRTVGLVALIVALVAGLSVLLGIADRMRPRGRLFVVAGAPARSVPVTRKGLTIGAAEGNGLVLGDPQVSRHHAVVRATGEGCVLVDLRSSNGTTVNGRRVSSRPLTGGETIVLGGTVELRFEPGMRFAWRRRRARLTDIADDTSG